MFNFFELFFFLGSYFIKLCLVFYFIFGRFDGRDEEGRRRVVVGRRGVCYKFVRLVFVFLRFL